MKTSKGRVVVAMSGGVDSAVSAALLLREGYEVFGIFAKTWTPDGNDGTNCTWVSDRRDALRIAAHLGIRLVTLDLEKEYRSGVVESLFSGYAAGQTPNPDVLCNRIIKFGALYKEAKRLGAEYIATGHYARINHESTDDLLRGIDSNKDQSYFLWDIPPQTLSTVLFPIGTMKKPDVRKLAEEFNLPVASKKDSQGICFLGQTDIQTFLGTRLPPEPGPIRFAQGGAVLGQHEGIHQVTVGQRHGLGSGSFANVPMYVVRLDVETNTVWVGAQTLLYQNELIAKELNWLVVPLEIGQSQVILAQVRYRQTPVAATLTRLSDDEVKVQFEQDIYAPTPGQSIVFYSEDQVLGGGIISTTPIMSASLPLN